MRVQLSEKSKEYAEALRHFEKTVKGKKILKIERCQNVYLWQQYTARKMMMTKRNQGQINERVLFHGSRTVDPDKICRGKTGAGFDPRLGSGYYGTGAYFAEKASYSVNGYSHSTKGGTSKQIFLARVLCGREKDYKTQKDMSLKRPPTMPGGDLYDSVCGGPHAGSIMYITYDKSQAYPMYLYTWTG